MKNVWLRQTSRIFTMILKTGRRSIISIRYYHTVFDKERADLSALAIGILSPDSGHAQVSAIKNFFFKIRVHFNWQR